MAILKKKHSLDPVSYGADQIVFGMAAYLVIYIAFIIMGTAVYINLPFRKLYVPLAGWSVLCLYSAFHSIFFKTDFKTNLHKIIPIGLALHLSFLTLDLNVQISGSSYLSGIYYLYIGTVTTVFLASMFCAGFFLRKDFFFIPLVIASIHLAVTCLLKGFSGYVAAAAVIAALFAAITRIDGLAQLLYTRIVSFFKDERKVIALLFLVGTIVRIVFAFHILKTTGGGSVFVDSSDDGRTYNANAWTMVTNPEKILKGGTLFPGVWEPGYIVLLSLVYKCFGHNFYAATFVQSLLGGALSVLSYYIAKELFGVRSISILTALLVSMSQILIMYMVVLGGEALILPLLAAFVLSYLRCFRKPDNRLYRVTAGLVLGLLCITRSLFMALPVLFFVTELFAVNKITFRKKAVNTLITVLVASFLIAPVTFINYLNDGKFNLVVKSGFRLEACWNAQSPWPDKSPDNRGLDALGVNPFKDPAGSLRVALKEPAAVAATACRIYTKRFLNYFIWPCFGFFDPILLINNSRVPNVFASSMEFYVYLIFLIGLWLVFRKSRKQKSIFLIFAVIFYSILAHCSLITIVSVRYRTPIVPYLMMIGAVGLYYVYRFSRPPTGPESKR
ncbi:MAG: glycosyltransferase family 39 protein [Candidatus Omnitrophica bacterium]|nr:glycosyltransferase family 39 protein [Candidatus Omnitrophota bacterium]